MKKILNFDILNARLAPSPAPLVPEYNPDQLEIDLSFQIQTLESEMQLREVERFLEESRQLELNPPVATQPSTTIEEPSSWYWDILRMYYENNVYLPR